MVLGDVTRADGMEAWNRLRLKYVHAQLAIQMFETHPIRHP